MTDTSRHKDRARGHSRRRDTHPPPGARPGGTPASTETSAGQGTEAVGTRAEPAPVPSEAQIRDAWLRAEACCECTKEAHGHRGRCNQFVVWADRGGTDKGAWEVRLLQDPRRPPCDILCAVCYAKVTGQLPKGA
jgi:hypothetical protein